MYGTPFNKRSWNLWFTFFFSDCSNKINARNISLSLRNIRKISRIMSWSSDQLLLYLVLKKTKKTHVLTRNFPNNALPFFSVYHSVFETALFTLKTGNLTSQMGHWWQYRIWSSMTLPVSWLSRTSLSYRFTKYAPTFRVSQPRFWNTWRSRLDERSLPR